MSATPPDSPDLLCPKQPGTAPSDLGGRHASPAWPCRVGTSTWSSLSCGQVVDAESFLVRANPAGRAVEAWSAWRLPFDRLTPAQLAYRAELSSALRSLGPAGVLHATYISSVVSPAVDAENLLFYNVGATAFQFLGSRALRYERVVGGPPPAPCRVSFTPSHYVHYSITSDDPAWLHTRQGRQMAGCAVAD